MEKLAGYEEAEALTGEYETLEAGGYICKILNAKEDKSKSGKRMLVIMFDIAEGEKAEFYQKRFKKAKEANVNKEVKYPGIYRQMMVGDKAVEYFKGMITSLENSNEGFKWNWDEKKLIGLKFGGLFGYEEYKGNDGKIKTTTKIRYIRPVEVIKKGDYTIPTAKKLAESDNNTLFTVVEGEEELPF